MDNDNDFDYIPFSIVKYPTFDYNQNNGGLFNAEQLKRMTGVDPFDHCFDPEYGKKPEPLIGYKASIYYRLIDVLE